MKTLRGSKVPVSALGFGAATLGNLFREVTDDDAYAAVDTAWEAGVRYFDTAPHYGLGLSERRLGLALSGRPRDAYTLSTKVGRLLEPGGPGGPASLDDGFVVAADQHRVWDFSADGVRRSIEDSLTRLGVDRIDVVYLHDADACGDGGEQALREAYPALERLRAEGVVGAIGAGMNHVAPLERYVTETDADVVLCAGRYSLLDQRAGLSLLPEALRRGRSVVIGGVFNSGLLADPQPGATYDYKAASVDLLGRALRIKSITEAHGVPLRAAALNFPFRHPAVASVLVGMRSAAEAADAAAMLARDVPSDLWDELKDEGLLTP
ncbi:aldo/keto reductase [Streptomyces sp. NBC_00237]|uniref:aldo/keto reductase n=1 Tax=Streptomyces sp. NBC_00237 TaxID=2975687 RepID=UPI00224D66FE|nr:aldo/keto reductase [Streptomyces sp. NBC_00237]MCX5201382.1 aldo/keto reductase [Streptomyces sp. NBC_00237]